MREPRIFSPSNAISRSPTTFAASTNCHKNEYEVFNASHLTGPVHMRMLHRQRYILESDITDHCQPPTGHPCFRFMMLATGGDHINHFYDSLVFFRDKSPMSILDTTRRAEIVHCRRQFSYGFPNQPPLWSGVPTLHVAWGSRPAALCTNHGS